MSETIAALIITAAGFGALMLAAKLAGFELRAPWWRCVIAVVIAVLAWDVFSGGLDLLTDGRDWSLALLAGAIGLSAVVSGGMSAAKWWRRRG